MWIPFLVSYMTTCLPARRSLDSEQVTDRPIVRSATMVVMGNLRRLVGIYEADGGLVGELRYAIRKLVGRGHCSLCDITHRGVRPKHEWLVMCEELSVPFDLVHLNERSPAVLQASKGTTPCVLAEVDDDLILILGRDELEHCRGEVTKLAYDLRTALSDRGIAIA